MNEEGKYRLNERVKVNLSIKTDFPAVGHIVRATIRLGKYFYRIKFDKPLFKPKNVIYENVTEISVYEDRLSKPLIKA